MNQAKHKGKFLYTMACSLLFVMSFTAVSAFADEGEIINQAHLGIYQNQNNSESFINRSEIALYKLIVIAVHTTDDKCINGSTNVVNMQEGYDGFYAFFDRARPSNENGVVEEDKWTNNVFVQGHLTTEPFSIKKRIRITTRPDKAVYIKN